MRSESEKIDTVNSKRSICCRHICIPSQHTSKSNFWRPGKQMWQLDTSSSNSTLPHSYAQQIMNMNNSTALYFHLPASCNCQYSYRLNCHTFFRLTWKHYTSTPFFWSRTIYITLYRNAPIWWALNRVKVDPLHCSRAFDSISQLFHSKWYSVSVGECCTLRIERHA